MLITFDHSNNAEQKNLCCLLRILQASCRKRKSDLISSRKPAKASSTLPDSHDNFGRFGSSADGVPSPFLFGAADFGVSFKVCNLLNSSRIFFNQAIKNWSLT